MIEVLIDVDQYVPAITWCRTIMGHEGLTTNGWRILGSNVAIQEWRRREINDRRPFQNGWLFSFLSPEVAAEFKLRFG